MLKLVVTNWGEPEQAPHWSWQRHRECLYVCIWLRVAFVCPNVPKNMPIQSITRNARAQWSVMPIATLCMEHAATKNEIEKPEQLLAQELKVKSLLAVLTKTLRISDNTSTRNLLWLDCKLNSYAKELTLQNAFHTVQTICSTEISSGSPPLFYECIIVSQR